MPWRRRRRSRRAGRRTMIWGLLLAIPGITLIPVGWLWYQSAPGRVPVIQRNLGDQAGEPQSGLYTAPYLNADAADAAWLRRPVYPYSVIPGGVDGIAEFREALLRDPVAARHYARFDIVRSRTLELQVDRMAYVSYRIKDRIFWTSRKVRLLRGEKVVTDGVNYARARCGNRISEVPQTPTSPQQPPAAEMETPLVFANRTVALTFAPLSAELMTPAAPAPTSETAWFVPPPFGFIAGASSPPVPMGQGSAPPTPLPRPLGVVIHGSSPPTPRHRAGCPYPLPSPEAPCKRPHPRPTVTPEPGTLLLISTGLAFMAFRGKRRREE